MSPWLAAVLQCFGVCPHRHYRRERGADGRLMLICEACDHSVVAITRDAGDVVIGAKLKAKLRRSRREMLIAKQAKSAAPSKVTAIRRAK